MNWRGVATGLIGLAVIVLVSCNTQERISATRSANYVVEGGVARGKVWHDNRQYAHDVEIETLYEDGIHDPKNAAIATLQDPSEALGSFPYDRRGGINWVKALDLGIIEPRADLKGDDEMMTMDMDILFKDTGHMPWVKFPHIAHTKWLACSNCHPDIFIPKKGANNPSMDGILAGEHCGRCHDKVAFALWICERCHSVPHDKSPQKWWGNHKNDRFSNVKNQSASQTTVE
ncbi:MAG: cytochrome c3 family protein [Gammaproteobacteria bacterium]|jgi:c(7)-type cytochrome triheme protein